MVFWWHGHHDTVIVRMHEKTHALTRWQCQWIINKTYWRFHVQNVCLLIWKELNQSFHVESVYLTVWKKLIVLVVIMLKVCVCLSEWIYQNFHIQSGVCLSEWMKLIIAVVIMHVQSMCSLIWMQLNQSFHVQSVHLTEWNLSYCWLSCSKRVFACS